MAQHPYSDIVLTHIVKEVIRKAVQIASAKPARIKVKKTRIFSSLQKTLLEFCEKVIGKRV